MAAGIRVYKVELEGQTPLLLHADNIEWADKMDAWKADPANKKNSKAGDDRTPAFRWIGCLYHDDEAVCMASDNLSRCLMEGGAMVPTGKGQKTFKAQTQSGMRIDGIAQPLLVQGKVISWEPIKKLMGEADFTKHMGAAKRMGFSLFIKRAGIGTTGKKHIRVRPRFDGWSLQFTVSVWDEQLTLDVLKNVITYAGAYKGLGDWRPGGRTPGSWGMFELKSIKEV